MSARDVSLHSIFTTAIEGGINYWCNVDTYHWCNDDGTDDVLGFKAEVCDVEDDGAQYTINRAVMAKGYRLATVGIWRDKIRWSTDKPPLVVDDNADWDYDAGDADCIVQLGLFGEVVYG